MGLGGGGGSVEVSDGTEDVFKCGMVNFLDRRCVCWIDYRDLIGEFEHTYLYDHHS